MERAERLYPISPELVADVVGSLVIGDRGHDRDEFRRIVRGNNTFREYTPCRR